MNDDWRDLANCKGHTDLMVLWPQDANYAFSPRRRYNMRQDSKIYQGLLLCQSCPVIQECNAWAEAEQETLIIAGGKVRGGFAHKSITFREWTQEMAKWEKSLRAITPQAIERQRQRAIRMHREAGHNVADAS